MKNACFWRRDQFSSSYLGEKLSFLTTSLNLVTFFERKTQFFGDETNSRRHFEVKKAQF
ncbi:hypothetical protein NST17_15795 [Caldifermentibacillus hisashii]|uniref:Uncharacterized protein n=1 Tax=Caldifermentibacillus hisashii TaxID=996558 RepID=A0ABU9K210_9BACI|nr:hypothetical protein [Caldibacillus thermoamylovorans]